MSSWQGNSIGPIDIPLDPLISPFISFVKHILQETDKKLPILDQKVWVAEEGGGDAVEDPARARLYYKYYRKPMANWLLMPAMSAMPGSVMKTALTQFGLRILPNTKPEVE
jgi:hypothetical protein